MDSDKEDGGDNDGADSQAGTPSRIGAPSTFGGHCSVNGDLLHSSKRASTKSTFAGSVGTDEAFSDDDEGEPARTYEEHITKLNITKMSQGRKRGHAIRYCQFLMHWLTS